MKRKQLQSSEKPFLAVSLTEKAALTADIPTIKWIDPGMCVVTFTRDGEDEARLIFLEKKTGLNWAEAYPKGGLPSDEIRRATIKWALTMIVKTRDMLSEKEQGSWTILAKAEEVLKHVETMRLSEPKTIQAVTDLVTKAARRSLLDRLTGSDERIEVK